MDCSSLSAETCSPLSVPSIRAMPVYEIATPAPSSNKTYTWDHDKFSFDPGTCSNYALDEVYTGDALGFAFDAMAATCCYVFDYNDCTHNPTNSPTQVPTSVPSSAPTPIPTISGVPFPAPTQVPTSVPSSGPTPAPSREPTPARSRRQHHAA